MLKQLSTSGLRDLLLNPDLPVTWYDLILDELESRQTNTDKVYAGRGYPWWYSEGDEQCEHKWRAIIGLSKIYYNCVYCDMKKEEYNDVRKQDRAKKDDEGATSITRRGATDGTKR